MHLIDTVALRNEGCEALIKRVPELFLFLAMLAVGCGNGGLGFMPEASMAEVVPSRITGRSRHILLSASI